eukprot:2546067-Pleurochrysis_carterae.AAC.1
MAMRVASFSGMSLLSAADSSSSMPDAVSTCIASTRWPATRASRRNLAADHFVAESVTPQLVEGLDG